MDEFKQSKLEEKNRLFESLKQDNAYRRRVKYVVKTHTEWVDNCLRALVDRIGFKCDGFALVGVGGYGRRQLNPYSDIDILLLSNKAHSGGVDGIVRRVLDFFYFLGYEISVSVRSVEECVEYSKKDDTIRTSLLDSRLICGDEKLFGNYLNVLNSKIIGDGREQFIEKKLEYMKARYKKFGGTVFVLEPNVKEGVGSLRDYHTLLWVSKVLFGTKNLLDLKKMGKIEDNDYRKLIDALYFLWQIRNALHFEFKKKNDVLFLDAREKIAHQLNFGDTTRLTSSEKLIRRYYYAARNVKNIVNRYLDIFLSKNGKNEYFFLDDKISINGNVQLKGDLSLYNLFEAFFYSGLYSKPINPKDVGKLRRVLPSISKKRSDRHLSFIFRQLLSLNKPVFETLSEMHEYGVLDRYIPEFGNICCLSKDGLYHKYTVDEHSLQAIKSLDDLYEYDIPKTFLMRLKNAWVNLKPHNRFVLRLACLLHDIGKIKQGKHEVVGYEMSKSIADRLNLGRDLKEKLGFLVKNHLLISSIISTRDVDDPKTLEDLLNVVDTKEKLVLLSLLTYADLKAVNDNVWTSWKEDLLESLYLKAMFHFENRDYDEYLKLNAADSKRKIKVILGSDYSDLIEKFPDSIFNDIRFDVMAQYIKDIKDTGRNAFVYREKSSEAAKVVVYYKNKFGFFNEISGILACLDASIVTAKSYDLLDGKIVDVFTVKVNDASELDDFKIEDLISEVESGEFDLEACMESKKRRFLNRLEKLKLEMSLQNVDVIVDNNQSELYTVIRVYAPDRIGLVYYITKVLVEFELQVGMFILDTKGSMAVDTFYVVDKGFKKIYSQKLIDLIKSRLYEVLV